MSAISINWSDLAKVVEVSGAFAVGIVVVFALGAVGLSRVATARADGASTTTRVSGYAIAGVAFATCAAATLYALYLLIPQFH